MNSYATIVYQKTLSDLSFIAFIKVQSGWIVQTLGFQCQINLLLQHHH